MDRTFLSQSITKEDHSDRYFSGTALQYLLVDLSILLLGEYRHRLFYDRIILVALSMVERPRPFYKKSLSKFLLSL